MKITHIEIYPAKGTDKLKASDAVVFDGCFKVRGIYIFPRKDNSNELYIAMPVKKIKDDEKISLAHPVTAEFRAVMEQAILEAYYKKMEELAADPDANAEEPTPDEICRTTV